MSFTNPHTGLSYDPRHTDWSYLLPAEQSDDDLATNAPQSCSQAAPTPIIAGFIALIKVFVCIVDLLDKSFPGPPPYFSLSPGALATTLFPAQEIKEASFRTPADLPLLESLFQVMTRLNVILSELPEPLSLRTRDSVSSDSAGHDTAYSSQFEIMRANIHITAIYFQSLVLEMCLNKLQGDQSSTPQAQQPPELPQRSISSQLWQMKESVARELLEILSCSSASVLESNGTSMVGFML
jgi:hypothetical protein